MAHSSTPPQTTASGRARDGALLALERIGKTFGRRIALREVSFSLPRGSFLALLGPNGAGKSTLLRIACGLVRPSQGRVLYERSAEDVSARLRPRVGYVAHQSLLYDSLTARQNITFFARLYGVPSPAERAAQLLRDFGLERHADRPVAAFSRGMEQRLALARALVHSPSLLLLDEPFAALDPGGCRLLASMLQELKEAGATILLASHALESALALADEVAILAGGELRHHGARAGLSPASLAELYESSAPRYG